MFCLDCTRMYKLNVKYPWAEQRCIVFVPLAYLSKCPISPRSEFAGKQRMRGAQVTGFWAPPPSRWKWDTLQSESLREFLWPAISGTGDKMKLRHPTYLCCHRARKKPMLPRAKTPKNQLPAKSPLLPIAMMTYASFWNILFKDDRIHYYDWNCMLRVGNPLTVMMKSWRQC